MAGRSLLPIILLGGLSATAASAGIGYGLGQYTVSGINPFYTMAHTAPEYRYRDERPASDPGLADLNAGLVPPRSD